MMEPNKLPLVKQSLRLLLDQQGHPQRHGHGPQWRQGLPEQAALDDQSLIECAAETNKARTERALFMEIESASAATTRQGDPDEAFTAGLLHDVGRVLIAGRFGDLTLRWLYFLCGLGGTVMVASGLVLWTVKRREKLLDPLRPPLGFRIVERLNIAVLAGFPLGCIAFFLANRLLPLAPPGRAEREITVLFSVWGVAALTALVLRPKRGWSVLLAAIALGLVGVVGCDLLMLRPGLIQWIADADWPMVTVDAVLLVLATGFGWSARRVARHQPRLQRTRATRTVVAAARLPDPVAAE